MNRKTLGDILSICFILALFGMVLADYFIWIEEPIHNTGTIRAIGIKFYSEPECINEVNAINWGLLLPDVVHNKTLWAKNIETVNCTLELTIVDWNPPIMQNYVIPSWNYTGQVLHVGEVIPIQFSVRILPNYPETTYRTFAFDYIVKATEVG